MFAWHNHLTLATMQMLLNLGWQVHHKDKNLQNDDPTNLELVKIGTHTSLHHLGKKLTPETKVKISKAKSGENHHFYGKKHSLEHRRKLSQIFSKENNPAYRHNIKNEIIKNLLMEGKTTDQIAKELSTNKTTICRRLKHLNYIFIGSRKKGRWILKQN